MRYRWMVGPSHSITAARSSATKTTGVYYFPGMYTAILPMIPGIYAITGVIRAARELGSRA